MEGQVQSRRYRDIKCVLVRTIGYHPDRPDDEVGRYRFDVNRLRKLHSLDIRKRRNKQNLKMW